MVSEFVPKQRRAERLIDFEDIFLLVQLENKVGMDHPDTCFDYVDSIRYEDELWVVKVFVEPVGNFELRGNKLSDLLRFWLELFRSQPKSWNSGQAAEYLDGHLSSFSWKNPSDAKRVWGIKSY